MATKELIKICKNGTKVWKYSDTCVKCNGSGRVPFNYADGVCFDCKGTGTVSWKEYEFTPEHAAKLEAKREKEARERENRLKAWEIIEAHRQALLENARFDRRKAEAEANKASTWQGSIGDKVNAAVTLTKSFEYETDYGITFLYFMKDDAGNVYKWSTGKGLGWYEDENESDTYHQVEDGERFTIKGTVKDHTIYNGIKQTALTRCRVSKA